MQGKRSIARLFITLFVLTLLQACSSGGDDKKAGPEYDPDLLDAQAYRSNALYSNVIANCIKAFYIKDLCSIETLPLIGLETSSPTIEDIMDRVVVSHDWMGMRFEQLLNELPVEMLTLFQAVTAIVIDSDIRPSFYLYATGAIYIDANNLWLTVTEKQTISQNEDFRSDYNNLLSFRAIDRYLLNGDYAYRPGSLKDYSTRELDDIVLLAARVLLHELAHANDIIPPGSFNSLVPTDTLYDMRESLETSHISHRLTELMPLRSDILFSLANVMFKGAEPSSSDIALEASQVGEAFEADVASDEYGYSDQYEDVAMLFESTMMKYFFGADQEVAFTNVPENPNYCDSFTIGWGAIGRIGDINVKPRAQFVASELLPNFNFSLFFQNLDAPTQTSGNWCIQAPSILSASEEAGPEEMPLSDRIRPYL